MDMSSDEYTSVDSGVDDLNVEDIAEVELSQPNDSQPVAEFTVEEYNRLRELKEENELLRGRLRELQLVNDRLSTDVLIWKIYNQELEAELDRVTKIVQSILLLKRIEAAWNKADVLEAFWTHKSNADDVYSTNGCAPNDRDLSIETLAYVPENAIVHEDADYVHIDIPTDDNEYIVLSLSDLDDM